MSEKVESILAELGTRYGNRPAVLDRLRPYLERILSPETPAEHRPELLEMVAAICQQNADMARHCARIETALQDICAGLERLRGILGQPPARG